MSFIYNMADTWNAGGTVFTSILMNVTDTASDPNSLLMDLQIGAVSRFRVTKGPLTAIIFRNNTDGVDSRIYAYSTGGPTSDIGFGGTGGSIFSISAGFAHVGMQVSQSFGWYANAPENSSPDLKLFRDAANTLAQRNSTTAQTFNLYTTFTDAANYEVLRFTSSGGDSFIQTLAGGSGAPRALSLQTGSGTNLNLNQGGTIRWQVGSAIGDFLPGTDNTNSIGSASARIVSLFLSNFIKQTAYTVATLSASLQSAASAGAGARLFITNPSGVTFSTTVTGSGGTVASPIYSDGTQWRIG